ncbi:acyltransferase family protein [Actinoplanes sp. NPDC049265]|uniref:acyltransferase family protein n=1 Tax=Actinoplanes sp. NPDC049265 TaxID=3363902 RepID=UPI00371BEDEF
MTTPANTAPTATQPATPAPAHAQPATTAPTAAQPAPTTATPTQPPATAAPAARLTPTAPPTAQSATTAATPAPTATTAPASAHSATTTSPAAALPTGVAVGAGRDRGIDVVRAVAVAGVVGGHWLVTGLVIGGDGAWHQASPLSQMPALAPASWFFQTLALLFFAGGFGAGRPRPNSPSRNTSGPPQRTSGQAGPSGQPDTGEQPQSTSGQPDTGEQPQSTSRRPGNTNQQPNTSGRPDTGEQPQSTSRRPGNTNQQPSTSGRPDTGEQPRNASRRPRAGALRRLAIPVAVLLGTWAVVLLVTTLAGVPFGTRRTIAMLVISPLWFLLPYLGLRAVTTPLARAVDRVGPLPLVAPAVALVALSDAGLLPLWVAVPAAWSVPWILGIAVARRGRGCLPARTLIVTGTAAMALLILVLHYPASAVGVPGDGRSNLSPPSLFAVALGLAQIGLYLTVANRLERGRPNGPVRHLNRAALPIYLGHQSVLVATVGAAHLITGGPVNGLLTAPAGPQWIFARLAWLPFLALVLAGLIRLAWPATRRSRAT